ncbi:unnamed protein product [Blepharisma stoltei]|uniref:Peptidase A1 domain-containing protein n=1 Tax=Blepharisma stoltei TaxID=1481888 RepID=A0AAU9IWW8_9CILI|nr:unnamed protein product [Blepharisma stoltei]
MTIWYVCLSIAFAAISIPLYKLDSELNFTKHSVLDIISPQRALYTSSSMTNYQNYQYYIRASIGTPAQVFTFMVDTGSTWAWIDWNKCSNCHTGTKFDPETSSSYHNTSQIESITYLKGSTKGYISTDIFSIGDDASLSVYGHSFLLVYEEADNDNMQMDGLIGFAFDALSGGTNSLMSSLKNQGRIQKQQFSVYLNDARSYTDLVSLGSSLLMIDGYDLSKYSSQGSFTYIDLANYMGHWVVECDGVDFNGTKLTEAQTAIIDTGTSLIIGPQASVLKILQILYYQFDCSADTQNNIYCNCDSAYPDLKFILSGHTFAIKPIDYFMVSQGRCYPVFGYSSSLNFWLLGDSFIRRFYINFDMEKRRIGFAKIKSLNDLGIGIESIPLWKMLLLIIITLDI